MYSYSKSKHVGIKQMLLLGVPIFFKKYWQALVLTLLFDKESSRFWSYIRAGALHQGGHTHDTTAFALSFLHFPSLLPFSWRANYVECIPPKCLVGIIAYNHKIWNSISVGYTYFGLPCNFLCYSRKRHVSFSLVRCRRGYYRTIIYMMMISLVVLQIIGNVGSLTNDRSARK